MFALDIHSDAQADLDDLWKTAPKAAARIVAILQEIQGNQKLLDSLLDQDFGADQSEKFHVSKWHGLWNQKLDIWRFKVWDLERDRLPYRVIYAYEIARRHFHVLGIFHRDFNYDPLDARSKRILKAYEVLTSS